MYMDGLYSVFLWRVEALGYGGAHLFYRAEFGAIVGLFWRGYIVSEMREEKSP